jgi:hypothetical protein
VEEIKGARAKIAVGLFQRVKMIVERAQLKHGGVGGNNYPKQPAKTTAGKPSKVTAGKP